LSRIASAKAALYLALVVLVGVSGAAVSLADLRLDRGQFLLLLGLPLASALHCGWYLQSYQRFGAVAAWSISGSLIAVMTGLWLIRGADTDLGHAALVLCIGPLVTGIGTLGTVAIGLRDQPGLRWLSPWDELRAGWPLFVSQFVAMLYSASGTLVVAAIAGARDAGAYGAVERVSTAVLAGCLLTYTAAYPTLLRFYQSDRVKYFATLRTILLAFFLMTGAGALAVLAGWSHVLAYLFGEDGANYASLVITAILWVMLGIFGPLVTGYFTVRDQRAEVFRLTLRVLGMSLMLGVPAVFVFGATGWMAALCVAQLLVIRVGWAQWKMEQRMTLAKEAT
jgi:O-antigen/teichoic acid export membrane protein